jgi:hypothetical protein
MRLVDDDGDWVEIEDLTAGDVLDIVLQYEAALAVKDQRIADLESDVEYYKYELARASW